MFGDIRLSNFMVCFELLLFDTNYAISDEWQIFVIRKFSYYWNKHVWLVSQRKVYSPFILHLYVNTGKYYGILKA